MNKEEAIALLSAALAPYKDKDYAELSALSGEQSPLRVKGPSGREYDVSILIYNGDELLIIEGEIFPRPRRMFFQTSLQMEFGIAPDNTKYATSDGQKRE